MAGLFRADCTPSQSLILCRCGARFAANTSRAAWRAAAEHATRAHPEVRRAAHYARCRAEGTR